MDSKYVLFSNGVFVSKDDLCHKWYKKGDEADEHKYTRREWKNGRWVYYYEDGSKSSTSKSTRNYITQAEAEQKRKEEEQKRKDALAKKVEKEKRAAEIDAGFDRLVSKGKEMFEKFKSILATRIVDTPYLIKSLFDDD